MSDTIPMTSAEMQEVQELVRHYYTTRFAAVAALAWLVYDWILTLDQEIVHVWLRPWAVSKVFYLWTRYVGMIFLAITTASQFIVQSPEIVCLLNFIFGAWGGVITQTTVSIIMILRLWAMYGGNKKLLTFLILLYICHFTALCAIFGYTTVHNGGFLPPLAYFTLGLNACFVPGTPPWFIGIWTSRLALDTIFFSLAVYKAYQQVRNGWSSSIMELLIKDNFSAFSLVLLFQVANLLILLVGEPETQALAVGFALATDVIVGSRLLLNTRQAVYERNVSPFETTQLSPLSRLQINNTPIVTFGGTGATRGSGREGVRRRSLTSLSGFEEVDMGELEVNSGSGGSEDSGVKV